MRSVRETPKMSGDLRNILRILKMVFFKGFIKKTVQR